MIRKIVIGSNYKDAMMYKIGQRVSENSDDGLVSIASFEDNGSDIIIYVENDNKEVSVWKEIPKWMCIRERDIR